MHETGDPVVAALEVVVDLLGAIVFCITRPVGSSAARRPRRGRRLRGRGGSAVRLGLAPSPTSAAQLASAMICGPGYVAPTGVPGLTANDQFGSGQFRISWTNLTRHRVDRSCDGARPAGPAGEDDQERLAVDLLGPEGEARLAGRAARRRSWAATGTSTLASSSVERKASVLPSRRRRAGPARPRWPGRSPPAPDARPRWHRLLRDAATLGAASAAGPGLRSPRRWRGSRSGSRVAGGSTAAAGSAVVGVWRSRPAPPAPWSRSRPPRAPSPGQARLGVRLLG